MIARFINLFARYPWLSVVTILGLTILSSIGFYDPYLIKPRPVVEGAVNEAPSSSSYERTRASRRAASAGKASLFSSDVVMVVTSDDFFNPVAAEALRSIVIALEELPQVARISWMDEAPPLNIFGMLQPALPNHRASQARFDAARQAALSNPLIGGQFLSGDGKTTLLMLEMDWFYARKNEDCTRRLEEVANNTIAQFPAASMKVAVTGALPMQLLLKRGTLENDRKFQWIAYATILILATIIFRGPTAVIVTALAPILGIFWTLGCLRFFELQDNPFNAVVVPVLLSLVGFTDGVHMMTQIRRHRADGMTGRQAAQRATEEVGLACFLTSFTTAVGFGSLGWAHHELVREFGWCCVLGVGITFIAVITAIPLACTSWLGRSVHHGIHHGIIESNVNRIGSLMLSVLRYPRWFTWGGIIVTLICTILTLQLRPDERAWTAIPERSVEAKALRHIDQAFGGLETARVEIHWNEDIPDASPTIVDAIDQSEEILRSHKQLGSPLGLASLLKAMPGEGDAVEKNSMRDLLPPPLKRIFLREEDRQATVVFRLQDIGLRKYSPVFKAVTNQLAELQDKFPSFTFELAGESIWRWKNLYQIMLDLLSSLSTAMLIIAITLGIAYKSVRLGLIAVIPNLFPLALTGAIIFLMGGSLELISVLSFTVCLGIAVDDTIHFLTRYTEERKREPDHEKAIHRSFQSVGGACIMTTIVLVCGFATVLVSDTRDHFIFAIMGGSTIAFALLGDMLILPAMLAIFDRPKPSSLPTSFSSNESHP
jgi:uncharacterized protein